MKPNRRALLTGLAAAAVAPVAMAKGPLRYNAAGKARLVAASETYWAEYVRRVLIGEVNQPLGG